MASGESFDQMIRRVESRRAGRAAEGVMPMASKAMSKDDTKGYAPVQRNQIAPGFKGMTKKKSFTPATRTMRGGKR